MKQNKLNRRMYDRIIRIHESINAGKFPSKPQLAKQLGVSVATIGRDFDYIRNFIIPSDEYDIEEEQILAYDESKHGYYYRKPFPFPFSTLSPSNMDVLSSAKDFLNHFEGTPLYDDLSSLIEYLAPNDKNKNPMINRIAVLPVPKAIYDKDIWKNIYEAMRTNQIVEFNYKDISSSEITSKRVRPYQLVMDDGSVLLYGYDEDTEKECLFYLSRMSSLVITKDKFELPKHYDLLTKCDGGTFGAYFEEEETTFKLRFYYEVMQVIKEREWAKNQQIEDHGKYVDLTFTSNQEKKVFEWILSLGATVQPLEPEWFVKKWKDTIIKTSKWAGIM